MPRQVAAVGQTRPPRKPSPNLPVYRPKASAAEQEDGTVKNHFGEPTKVRSSARSRQRTATRRSGGEIFRSRFHHMNPQPASRQKVAGLRGMAQIKALLFNDRPVPGGYWQVLP